MTRPIKHPKTGIYLFRKTVPEDLRPLLGKREEKRSLGTRDPAEAKRVHALVCAEVAAQWTKLRARVSNEKEPDPTVLNEHAAHEHARWIEHYWFLKHRDNPSQQRFWRTDLFDLLWKRKGLSDIILNPGAPLFDETDAKKRELESWCLEEADLCADVQGWKLDETSRINFAKALGAAVQRASVRLATAANGELVDGDYWGTRVPQAGQGQSNGKRPAISLTALLDSWWQEARAAGRKASTYESYKNTFTAFITFLGHDDAGRVSAPDVVRFKDHRLTTPSPKTGRAPSAKSAYSENYLRTS